MLYQSLRKLSCDDSLRHMLILNWYFAQSSSIKKYTSEQLILYNATYNLEASRFCTVKCHVGLERNNHKRAQH